MLECVRLSFHTSMRTVRAAVVLVTASCLLVPMASAMRLSDAGSSSRIGQPLDFHAVVDLEGQESLSPRCVRADVSAGETRVPSSQVKVGLREQGAGRVMAHVTTALPMTEPVVTVSLSVGCPAKAVERYVVMLEPAAAPSTGGENPASGTQADLGEGRARLVLRPGPGAPQGGGKLLPTPASQPVPGANGGGDVPPRTMTSAASGSAASAAVPVSQAAAASALRETERLRRENEAAREALAAAQRQLRTAESARGDVAVYALIAIVVLLLGAVGVLAWRLRRVQNLRAWETADEVFSDEGVIRPSQLERTMPSVYPPLDEATMTSMRVMASAPAMASAMDDEFEPEPVAAAPVTTATVAAAEAAGAASQDPLSAEELIDLDQQVEFFIALGKEESAIDLLMSHVRSSGGRSPMPYVRLLEIYRRRDDTEAYDRIRERFNRRFNATAPTWGADLHAGRSLEERPEVMVRIQTAWSDPKRVAELLEALLLRRDASDASFDLPAFEELLLLYAVARDLADQAVGAEGVDLLLPLGEVQQVTSVMHADLSRLPPWPATVQKNIDLDLDVREAHRPSADGPSSAKSPR